MLAFRRTRLAPICRAAFNHAGPRQSDDYVTSSFARQIAEIERGLAPSRSCSVGNLESRRDITDVRDVVRAYRLLLRRGRPARPYNVCSGTALPGRATCSMHSSRCRDCAIAMKPTRRGCGRATIRSSLGIARASLDEVGWAPRDSDRAHARAICSTTGGESRLARRSHDLSGRAQSARARSCTSRWARSRCCCDISTWWQAALLAGAALAFNCFVLPRIGGTSPLSRRRSTRAGTRPACCSIRSRCSCPDPRPPRPPRHRCGGVGNPGGRRRHGHDRRHARAADRAIPWNRDKTCRRIARAVRCSAARRARSWRGGAGRP